MARINGVSKSKAGPMVRLVYRLGPRMMKKLTGREPQTGSGIEPMEIWAYQPKMMIGTGKFNQAVRKGKSVDERLKNLIELKGAQMIGCEFCVDLGSQICRHSGFSDDELLALPRYRESELFTEREKLARLHGRRDANAGRGHRRAIRTDQGALQRRAARRDHRTADARQPRPVQRRLRDRLGRLQRGNGLRPARPPRRQPGAFEDRLKTGLTCRAQQVPLQGSDVGR
ncbi:MAG: carboxymuconolactone decarboxylase family protein [Solirubrobacteraceae bacterium]